MKAHVKSPSERTLNFWRGFFEVENLSLGLFVSLTLLLIAIAVMRSAISTRLDSFTQDEAYHIAAGVSYVKIWRFSDKS